MRCTGAMPGAVSQSLTSIFTSKSLALSPAIDCSAVGDLIVTLGSFLGLSEAVVAPKATSGSAGFSAAGGGVSAVAGGGGVSAGGGGGGVGGRPEARPHPPPPTPSPPYPTPHG